MPSWRDGRSEAGSEAQTIRRKQMMNKITKHPLRITADALKKAFQRCGFVLYDNGEYPELEQTEANVRVFEDPGALTVPVLLMDGQYALRTQLLPFLLPKAAGSGTVMAAACGKVFDGTDTQYPAHLACEGVISGGMSFYDLGVLWKKLVKEAFGAAYDAELVPAGEAGRKADLASWGENAMKATTLQGTKTWAVTVKEPEGTDFVLGYFGTLTWIGAALLGREAAQTESYAFSIDVDRAACRQHGLKDREELFDNRVSVLAAYEDGSTSASDSFEDRCRDVLRAAGFTEGFGLKLYPDGVYKKMNMIQDEWDLNNKGVLLKEPLGEFTGLPTVLTPALEQMLCEKWAAGEADAKIFEISHIFVPREGSAPVEKLALSFGAYGEGMDLAAFTAEVDSFLTKIGNKNHFYFPTTMAIAYNIRECRLLLDEKMNYLGGNFGGISDVAEKNYGIGTHAYMANLELRPLENKAKEEYGYIPPELR